jgi:membrane protein YqaA with SNARE-associated domain
MGRAANQLTGKANNKVVDELKKARRTNEPFLLIILFLFVAFVPLPSEVLLVPLGFMNYNFMKVLPILLVGNLTFNIVYSLSLITLFKAIFA